MKRLPREKRIKRRTVYQGKILDLFVDQVRVPDGSAHIREVVGHCPAVAVVPLCSDRSVLLIQQYRYAIGRVLWEIPAGLLNPGETPRQAAARELREETGYQAGSWSNCSNIFSSPGYCQERIQLYLAWNCQEKGAQALDVDEFVTVVRMPLAKALQMIEQGKIVDGKTVLGLLVADKTIRSGKNKIVHS